MLKILPKLSIDKNEQDKTSWDVKPQKEYFDEIFRRNFIGIEKEPKYVEIANKRIENELFQLKLVL